MKSLYVLILFTSTAVGFVTHPIVLQPLAGTTRRPDHSSNPSSCRNLIILRETEKNSTNGLRHTARWGGQTVWGSVKSVASRLDKIGSSLKPKARQASVMYTASTAKGQRIKYFLKTWAFYSLYLLYQALRGVVAVMPAVYLQLYAKFANVVEYPFAEDNSVIMRDVDPETGNLRWRTRVTVGLLAAVLSASYIVMGAMRVLWAMGQSLRQTRSLIDAMTVAVDKQEENEIKMQRLGNRPLPRPKNYF